MIMNSFFKSCIFHFLNILIISFDIIITNFLLRRLIWHLVLAMGPKSKYLLRLSHLYEVFKKEEKQTFCHRMIGIQCPSLSTIFTKCNIISIFICDCQVSSCDETLIFIDKMDSSYSSWFALDAKLYIPSALKKIIAYFFFLNRSFRFGQY